MAKREPTPREPKPKAGGKLPRRWHVVLVNGEKTVTAVQMGVNHHGALMFADAEDEIHTVYTAGLWQFAEPETRDQ